MTFQGEFDDAIQVRMTLRDEFDVTFIFDGDLMKLFKELLDLKPVIVVTTNLGEDDEDDPQETN